VVKLIYPMFVTKDNNKQHASKRVRKVNSNLTSRVRFSLGAEIFFCSSVFRLLQKSLFRGNYPL
jgi:hypothetical protein